jgi:hypothetical protein
MIRAKGSEPDECAENHLPFEILAWVDEWALQESRQQSRSQQDEQE